MKLKFWLLALIALLLYRIFAALIPFAIQKVPSAASQPQATLEPVSADASVNTDCQTLRPAVVTLYAGKEFGSGSIISPTGLVLTNHHVIQEVGGGVVRARTWAGGLYTGQVVAADPVSDLALVQLNTPDRLPTIRLSRRNRLQPGQPVCAIGSPYGRAGVLSRGTLMGWRSNGDLQSTLLLHPGNSGGPLLNLQGELIGVNKTIWRARTGENTGISFAVSAATAAPFIAQYSANSDIVANQPAPEAGFAPLEPPPLEFGFNPPAVAAAGSDSVPAPSGFRLGVMIDPRSLVIRQVEPRSPAERAGLSVGDRVVALNGHSIQGLYELQALLQQHPDVLELTVSRSEQRLHLQVRFEGNYRASQ